MTPWKDQPLLLSSTNLYFFSLKISSGPSDSGNFTHNLRGVIPRSFEYLFFLIEREKEKVRLFLAVQGMSDSAGKPGLCGEAGM